MLPLKRTKCSGTVQGMKFAYMTYMIQERSGEVTVDRNREKSRNTKHTMPSTTNFKSCYILAQWENKQQGVKQGKKAKWVCRVLHTDCTLFCPVITEMILGKGHLDSPSQLQALLTNCEECFIFFFQLLLQLSTYSEEPGMVAGGVSAPLDTS